MHSVNDSEVKLLRALVLRFCRNIKRGNICFSRELFYPDEWQSFPPPTRRLYGKVICELARQQQLPLVPLGPNSAKHQKYLRV